MGLNDVQTNVASNAFTGRAMGGQQPLVGATIGVYAYGTGGYGSAATLLASTTTDSYGYFSFAPGAYTCPQSNTPVYLLSTGGDPGVGAANPNAVQAIALGTCTVAKQSSVVMNEVTTVAMAYALAHFFNSNLSLAANGSGAATGDNFGGPSTISGSTTVFSRGLVLGNNNTTRLIATNTNGYATPSSGIMTTESGKVLALGNLLAACVNSTGQTSTTDSSSNCGRLFTYTTNANGRPTDTLQAAVQIALNPAANVSQLFNTIPAQTAFGTTLTTAPNDWSLAISFTSTSMGLGVNTNTVSTIDIDSSNRVWFPSTLTGAVGIGNFDLTTGAFSGPYNSTSMVHPQQVAIDGNGYAWVADPGGATLSGYNTTTPSNYTAFTLANSTSYAVGVRADGRVVVGLYDSGTSKYRAAEVTANRTAYAPQTTALYNTASIPQSIASDSSSTILVSGYTTAPRFYNATQTSTNGTNAAYALGNYGNFRVGQSAYTGASFITSRILASGATGNDALCFDGSSTNCDAYKNFATFGAIGVTVDGGKQIWVANASSPSVGAIPIASTTSTAGTEASYLTAITSSANRVVENQYIHDSNNGGTITSPQGIAVDNEGNVWVSNAGCNTTGCTPGSFVLTLFPGQAYPTITPVAAQVSSGNQAGTQPAY